MLKLRLIALTLAAIPFLAPPVQACACVGASSGNCQVPTASVIVLATVMSKDMINNAAPVSPETTGGRLARPAYRSPTDAPLPRPIVRVTLSVDEVFRGSSGKLLTVQTDLSTCGYPFETAHQYLIFANEFQGNLSVTICSATRPAKMAASTLQQLRALRDGTPLPDLFGFAGTHPIDSSEAGWEQVQPVPHLIVTAESEQHTLSQTETAEDGTWAFRNLPPGRYQIRSQPPPGRLALWGGSADHLAANAGPGNTCPVNFEVFYDGRLSGTVARADGESASGYVFARYQGPQKVNAAAVGGKVIDGRFAIERLPPGRYLLVFQPETRGASPVYYPGTQVLNDATPVEIGDGEHVEGLRFSVY